MNGQFVPKKVFFTSGCGSHEDKLTSFEMALRKASIECYNLVGVSSILPPKCRIISKSEGIRELFPGSVVFTVMSRLSSKEPSRRITASVGCAIPEKPDSNYGYFTEYHTYDETREEAGRYAEKIAEHMFDSVWNMIPAKTMNITESAIVDEDGLWMTVIAAGVFIME